MTVGETIFQKQSVHMKRAPELLGSRLNHTRTITATGNLKFNSNCRTNQGLCYLGQDSRRQIEQHSSCPGLAALLLWFQSMVLWETSAAPEQQSLWQDTHPIVVDVSRYNRAVRSVPRPFKPNLAWALSIKKISNAHQIIASDELRVTAVMPTDATVLTSRHFHFGFD